MAAIAVFVALGVSVAALIHLAHTDPKRRRVFGLAEYDGRRWTYPSLALLALPGVLLLVSGNGAGFTVWLGALTVLGWGVAALDPHRSAAVGADVRRWTGGAGRAVAASRSGVIDRFRACRDLYRALGEAPARIAALEARIDELERKVAVRAVEGGAGGEAQAPLERAKIVPDSGPVPRKRAKSSGS